MSSTPMHGVIYKAFGWQPPRFAHTGLLQKASGEKLSKREVDEEFNIRHQYLRIHPSLPDLRADVSTGESLAFFQRPYLTTPCCTVGLMTGPMIS